MNLINFGKSLKQTIMTNEQFQIEFLNPLVENFFSQLSDYQNVTPIEFFRKYKEYFRDFIFRKLPIIECERKLDDKEKQKEFVNYFFNNNTEYYFFKSELTVKGKVSFAIPKSTKIIDSMRNDIKKYDKLKKMADNANVMDDDDLIIMAPEKLGSQSEMGFYWKYCLPELLPIYLNLLSFLYSDTMTENSIGINDIPEPDIESIRDCYKREKHKFCEMSNNIADRKKETVEVYAGYFISKITSKIQQYHEIHLALGWGVTETEYEKKSEQLQCIYDVIIKKYYRTYHRNS